MVRRIMTTNRPAMLVGGWCGWLYWGSCGWGYPVQLHLSTARITTIPQLACLHFDSLCWLQVLPFVSICSEKSAHLTRLLALLNKEVRSGHDAMLCMLRTYAELAAPAGVQAASGMRNNGLQLRNVDLLFTCY